MPGIFVLYLLCLVLISTFSSNASSQQMNKKFDGTRLNCSHLCTRELAHPILSANTSWLMPCSCRRDIKPVTTSDQLSEIGCGFL